MFMLFLQWLSGKLHEGKTITSKFFMIQLGVSEVN